MEKDIGKQKATEKGALMPGAQLHIGDPDTRRQAAAVLGAARSERKKASSAANGKLGGKKMTPMQEIACTCGAGDVTINEAGKPLHPTTCPRGRVIRYRLTKGLPLT